MYVFHYVEYYSYSYWMHVVYSVGYSPYVLILYEVHSVEYVLYILILYAPVVHYVEYHTLHTVLYILYIYVCNSLCLNINRPFPSICNYINEMLISMRTYINPNSCNLRISLFRGSAIDFCRLVLGLSPGGTILAVIKGTGTRDLIWLKVVSLDRSWLVGLTDDH